VAVIRRFRHIRWTLKRVESRPGRAHIQCVSGAPPCGAVSPSGAGNPGPDGAFAWVEAHFRETGHRRYDRTLSDTLQWDPQPDVDPRTLLGVTT
jgi:hypothetical protein